MSAGVIGPAFVQYRFCSRREMSMSTFSMSARQLDTLRAAADRIIPPDETCGAAEAGAAEFVLRLLKDELPGERATYLEGLDGIDREAEARHGRAFAVLAPSASGRGAQGDGRGST